MEFAEHLIGPDNFQKMPLGGLGSFGMLRSLGFLSLKSANFWL
jgi:hypothetical protein